MNSRRGLISLVLLFALLPLTGCGSVISENILKGADRSATIDRVQASPNAFIGRKVVWGGVVVSAQNLEGSTEIEVLETPLTYDDSPADYSEGQTRGRFIVEAMRFLDTAVFKEGKRITVAGVVKEFQTRKIGKMDYHYPVIRPLEIKLFEPPPPVMYHDVSPMYRPWGPYYPYYPWPYPPPPPVPGYPYPYPYPYPY